MIPTAPLFSQRILPLVEAGNHHLLTHSTTVYSEIKKKKISAVEEYMFLVS